MTATNLWTLVLVGLLLTVPAVAADTADDGETQAAPAWPPCEAFQYWLDPPSYELRPECLVGPLLDNLP